MSTPLRRGIARTAIAVAGLVLLFVAVVFAVSEWMIQRGRDAPVVALHPARAPDPASGEHLAKVVGCWAGCHGDTGEDGSEVIEGIRRITAPTLTQVVPRYSDAELARLVRYGVKRDGRSAVGMNAGVLWPLGDQDLADIFAHLRRQPARPAIPRKRELSFRGRLGLVTGEWKVSADQVDLTMPRWGELPRTTPFERGRYLASVVCSECHGPDFNGYPLEGGRRSRSSRSTARRISGGFCARASRSAGATFRRWHGCQMSDSRMARSTTFTRSYVRTTDCHRPETDHEKQKAGPRSDRPSAVVGWGTRIRT